MERTPNGVHILRDGSQFKGLLFAGSDGISMPESQGTDYAIHIPVVVETKTEIKVSMILDLNSLSGQ